MPLNISKKYMFIPVLYISVIVFLIYMQLSAKTGFSEYYSFAEISGEKKTNSNDYLNSLYSLEINTFGLVFNFSKSRQAAIITADNNITELKLQGFKNTPEGIDILFSGNIRFRVFISENRSAAENGILVIEPVIPYSDGTVKEVSVAFTISDPNKLTPAASFPAAGYTDAGKNYFLASGRSSVIDYEKGIVRIRPDSSGRFYVSISESPIDYQDPYEFWVKHNFTDEVTEEERQLENSYTDTAYRSWRISRFDRENGKWLDKNGRQVYSREIISSLASELFRRNEFSDNQWIYRAAGAQNPDQVFLETGLITGNTVSVFNSFMEKDLKQLADISEMVKNNDIRVFNIPGIVSIITDRGPYSLLQELIQLADSRKLPELDSMTAAGLAEVYLEYFILNPEDSSSVEKLKRIINEKILPGIIKTDKGVFIVSNDYADTLFTLKISRLLKNASDAAERDFLYSLGEKLLFSLLQFSDSNGFLPEKIRISGSEIINTEGAVEQEYVYPYLDSAEYLPQIRSLKNIIAPGAWIATCAGEINAEISDEGTLNISTLLPAGNTEYIIIQGISPVSGINLYGRDWTSDPLYERYRAGWVYSDETQTLFIKILHNTDTETIIISY